MKQRQPVKSNFWSFGKPLLIISNERSEILKQSERVSDTIVFPVWVDICCNDSSEICTHSWQKL